MVLYCGKCFRFNILDASIWLIYWQFVIWYLHSNKWLKVYCITFMFTFNYCCVSTICCRSNLLEIRTLFGVEIRMYFKLLNHFLIYSRDEILFILFDLLFGCITKLQLYRNCGFSICHLLYYVQNDSTMKIYSINLTWTMTFDFCLDLECKCLLHFYKQALCCWEKIQKGPNLNWNRKEYYFFLLVIF